MVKNSAENGWQHWVFLVWELGWVIVLPLVVCMLGGVWLDSLWGVKPFMTIAGLFVAATFSTVFLIKKIGAMMKELE